MTYVGEVDRQAKLDLLGGADCLLNPILWPEPFGMVMIEALACGTPVVSSDYGAAPEIVEDGVVGFVRHGRSGLVDALGRIHEIDRAACRARVEEHFSVERMVAQHVAVYEMAVGERALGVLLRPPGEMAVLGAA